MKDAKIAIETVDVCKKFGSYEVLHHISINVAEKQTLGIVGPNGAGKTTLLSCIAGFLNLNGGDIRFFGQPIETYLSSNRSILAILPQDAMFIGERPIFYQMSELALISEYNKEEKSSEPMPPEKRAHIKAERALKQLQLWNDGLKKFNHLSHGMKKRLRVAQAVMEDADILLLDEPTSGLDPVNAKNIQDLIREYEGGKTILISSHNLEEIGDLCSEVLFLKQGKVAGQKTMNEIKSSILRVIYVLKPGINEKQEVEIANIEGVTILKIDKKKKRIMLDLDPGKGDTIRQNILKFFLQNNIIVEDLKQGSGLEEEFLRLTNDN